MDSEHLLFLRSKYKNYFCSYYYCFKKNIKSFLIQQLAIIDSKHYSQLKLFNWTPESPPQLRPCVLLP